MKRAALHAGALALVVAATVAAPATARAVELRLLGAGDLYSITAPHSSSLEAGQLGTSLRADLTASRFVLQLDYRDLEPLVVAANGSDPARHELYALSFTARDLGGRVDLTIGRFSAPGGFLLTTDGADLRVRFSRRFGAEVFGGLRGYTSGRSDTELNGWFLPLVGAAFTLDHPIVRASIAGTYTRDVIEIGRGYSPAGGTFEPNGNSAGTARIESTIVPELFLDAQLLVLPHPSVVLVGGASAGSRYDVSYTSAPGTFAAPPNVDNQYLDAFMAYALVEWRPIKRLRLSYAFDLDRVKITTPVQPLNNALTTAGGSFEDHTIKASLRAWRGLRFEARYRLRFRENTDVIHRIEGGLDGDRLIAGFGLFATLGGDAYQTDRNLLPAKQPQNNVEYTGGLSFVHQLFDLRAGLLYTDAIGSGVGFSTHAQQAMGSGPTTELFPYSLAAQRIVFLRAFAWWRGFFAGFDGEIDLDASQFRSMAQLGYGR